VTDDHVTDDLAAYVLESLDPPERTRVEVHVATCRACTQRLEEYQAVVGALPLALPPMIPPPEAWATIRSVAGARRGRVRSWRRVAWPAVTVLAASLMLWNVVLQRELIQYRSGPQVEALARRPGRMVILLGTSQPGASARLFIASDGGHGHLAVAGLDPLPRDRVYQLWFVRTGAPAVSAAKFTVDDRRRAWVAVEPPTSLDDVAAITVTAETAPGSAAPTGAPQLNARSWR
jgi:anti-sigma-K factor RskA